MFKLRKKKEEAPSIICVGCEERMPLWYIHIQESEAKDYRLVSGRKPRP